MSLLGTILNRKKYVPEPLRPEIKAVLEGNVILGLAITSAHRRKTDLLEAEYNTPASEQEAIYRGRIYSLSGKDPHFPKLPLEIIELGLVLTPFRYKKDKPRNCQPEEVIAYSNRPWKDDRSEEEKKAYENKVDIWTRSAYRWLGEFLPEHRPSTYEEFKSMKKDNTQVYQELQKKAAELGRKI